jgi:GT2 family glycosyltransferase/glycosyltransferase involved in cell wall biosynthesis
MPRASVVIPIYEQPDLLRACLASLERAGLDGLELVLVDNASSDTSMPALLDEMQGGAQVLRNAANLGFAAACNQGASAAAAPVVVFLNTDTEVRSGWLEPLLAATEDPRVGLAGSRLLYPNGRVQHAGMALVAGGPPVHIHRGAPGDHEVVSRTRDLTLVTAACVAIRRHLFIDAGGFDEAYRNGYEDCDLALRLATRGFVARYCGQSVVTHHESMSPGRSEAELDNARRFHRRWWGWPGDRDRLLSEDGLPVLRAADTVWEGPLFDGSREAAAGIDRVCELDAEGHRVGVVERCDAPAIAEAACPPAVLAALNRHGIGHPVEPVDGGATARLAAPRRSLGERPTMPCPHGIGWWGPVLGRSGYASAGRGLLAAAMSRRPVRVVAADQGDAQVVSADIDPWVWVLHHIPVGPDGTNFWQEVAIQASRTCVGATCFESDSVPPAWVGACNAMQSVWVPGEFNRRTFAHAGIDPERLRVVPYPVDTDRFAPGPDGRGDGRFTFLSVFEWTWRKGWDVLLQAYVEEFSASDPVRLRLLTYRGAGSTRQVAIPVAAAAHLVSLGYDPEDVADIELLLQPVSEEGLVNLYREADAFVLASRGEGAGMPVLEAMACGTPVVATDFGGHAEYMDSDSSYPVAVERMVLASDELVHDNALYVGQTLAEPSVASLRAQMRTVYEDRAGARGRAAAARRLVEERLSVRAVAATIDAVIHEMVDERAAAA